ncbi:MAG TPA: flagellar type III secretion system pore protein FliP [Candidatus Binataceae bacterium]|jgi:flagellar biosynthetic protein FliP|nr:flagellar type III secretion system pore protein FliP [Candidatus Binataceae bacterium]
MKGQRFLVIAGGMGAATLLPGRAAALDIAIDTGGRGAGPLELAALLTLISLAPALLIMMTSFTRIVIVLALLRQALGLQQTPPNMVITGVALFLTMLVMGPTWRQIRADAVDPYLAGQLPPAAALNRAEQPLRDFMLRQTRTDDLTMARGLLARGHFEGADGDPRALPFFALVPAFISSELTAAFRVGFMIYLPFLVIDLVTSSVLMALGMFMLPPSMVSIPLKLLIFTLASGWPLLLGSLGASFS